jgi:transposase
MRHVRLTKEEEQSIEELHKTSASFVVRGRCLILLLSNQGNSVKEVSKLVNVHRHTVERLLNKWSDSNVTCKLSLLYSSKGQGAKLKLSTVADILPGLIEQHNRNLKPILEILEKEHSIKVCKSTLQHFLKGAGLYMETS